jgi:hypothetical protein
VGRPISSPFGRLNQIIASASAQVTRRACSLPLPHRRKGRDAYAGAAMEIQADLDRGPSPSTLGIRTVLLPIRRPGARAGGGAGRSADGALPRARHRAPRHRPSAAPLHESVQGRGTPDSGGDGARRSAAIPCDGYAIGGLSSGGRARGDVGAAPIVNAALPSTAPPVPHGHGNARRSLD